MLQTQCIRLFQIQTKSRFYHLACRFSMFLLWGLISFFPHRTMVPNWILWERNVSRTIPPPLPSPPKRRKQALLNGLYHGEWKSLFSSKKGNRKKPRDDGREVRRSFERVAYPTEKLEKKDSDGTQEQAVSLSHSRRKRMRGQNPLKEVPPRSPLCFLLASSLATFLPPCSLITDYHQPPFNVYPNP